MTTAGNCPERFIAVEAGQVAVFRGRPGNGLLLHKTDIRVDWLPPGKWPDWNRESLSRTNRN